MEARREGQGKKASPLSPRPHRLRERVWVRVPRCSARFAAERASEFPELPKVPKRGDAAPKSKFGRAAKGPSPYPLPHNAGEGMKKGGREKIRAREGGEKRSRGSIHEAT